MKPMRKKLVNQKREVYKLWPKEDFVDHIRNYPDQDKLNYDADGNKRKHQVGIMAEVVEKNDYQMTDNQYYSMIDGFAKVVVPEMKVVGVSFRDPDIGNFKMDLVGERRNGVVSTYDVDYHLKPEPDNPYDENAVGVWMETNENELEQIGYLSKDFVAEYPVEEQVVQGLMEDHSNGKFKNVSYHIAIDTDKVLNTQKGADVSLEDLLNEEEDISLEDFMMTEEEALVEELTNEEGDISLQAFIEGVENISKKQKVVEDDVSLEDLLNERKDGLSEEDLHGLGEDPLKL